jgi:hypothetical protein
MKALSYTAINLSSTPFRRERAERIALAGICGLLTISFVVITSLFIQNQVQAAGLRKTIASQTAALIQLQTEQSSYSKVLSLPRNADVFSWSVLLNQVIARRGLSWTRIFEDLSTVMPNNMRLIGIRLPQLASEDAKGTNRVQLDMVVATQQPSTIVDLLNGLQKSSLFGPATVVSQVSPTQNDPESKFRVLVAYAQTL